MTNQLSNVQSEAFENMAKLVYQEDAKNLGMNCRIRRAKTKSVHFPVLGTVPSNLRGAPGSDLVITNQTATDVEVVANDYTAAEYTDLFLKDKIEFDANMELAKSISMSLTRRAGQIKIDALNASTTSKIVANNISGSVDNLTVAAFQDAARQLDLDGVPDTDRHAIVHVSGIHHMLEDAKTTSTDFVNLQGLLTGKLDDFYGFMVHKVGNFADLDGLPIDGSGDRTNFFYHKDALGMLINTEPSISTDWVPQKRSYLVSGALSIGAKEIDGTGIVKVITREA